MKNNAIKRRKKIICYKIAIIIIDLRLFTTKIIARKFCRIRSGLAPDLFENCSEFARNSGGNHA